MGEIGIKEDDFLYRLKNWQLTAIRNGYRKRSNDYQILMRWQTWALLKGFCGIEADSPEELITLPCDDKPKDIPSDEEINKLIADCQKYNNFLVRNNDEKVGR